jgi:hypothetical protein
MPDPATCFQQHATMVAQCVEGALSNPFALFPCIAIADHYLIQCLTGQNLMQGLLQVIENSVLTVEDALEELQIWAQQNPGAAVGGIVVVGVVTAMIVFGPGAVLAFVIL